MTAFPKRLQVLFVALTQCFMLVPLHPTTAFSNLPQTFGSDHKTYSPLPRNVVAIPNDNSFFSDRNSNDEIDKTINHFSRKKKTSLPTWIKFIDTAQQFEKLVEEEEDKIVVVRFTATWCKTCKAMSSSFHRLAEKLHGNIIFVEVSFSPKNTPLFERLGVPGVPYGHIYHPKLGLLHDMQLAKRPDTVEFEKILNRIFYCI